MQTQRVPQQLDLFPEKGLANQTTKVNTFNNATSSISKTAMTDKLFNDGSFSCTDPTNNDYPSWLFWRGMVTIQRLRIYVYIYNYTQLFTIQSRVLSTLGRSLLKTF